LIIKKPNLPENRLVRVYVQPMLRVTPIFISSSVQRKKSTVMRLNLVHFRTQGSSAGEMVWCFCPAFLAAHDREKQGTTWKKAEKANALCGRSGAVRALDSINRTP
jgi:hypothetical protein